jgi:hypothetical protein
VPASRSCSGAWRRGRTCSSWRRPMTFDRPAAQHLGLSPNVSSDQQSGRAPAARGPQPKFSARVGTPPRSAYGRARSIVDHVRHDQRRWVERLVLLLDAERIRVRLPNRPSSTLTPAAKPVLVIGGWICFASESGVLSSVRGPTMRRARGPWVGTGAARPGRVGRSRSLPRALRSRRRADRRVARRRPAASPRRRGGGAGRRGRAA